MNSHQLRIDLNADLAESVERLANGSDAELMHYITSANIACGAHAGDAVTMEQTLELAQKFGLTVGAHPSYPDRENFGRVALDMPHADLTSSIHDQLTELATLAQRLEIPLVHVKPHGALYHACNTDAEVARAVARAVLAVDSHLIMIGQAASSCLAIYREMGLRAVAEAFADRAYEPDGALRSRKLPGSLLEDPTAAAAQAENIVVRGVVVTTSGSELPLAAETLCMHSDTPGASAIARSVRERLTPAGIQIRPLV